MKTPVVDYRKFRLDKRNAPEFCHLKLLLGWPVYLVCFFLTEALIPEEACYSVHCWIDDRIPFHEGFLIPYVGWYGLLLFTLFYFLLYDIESFRRFSKYIFVTQGVAIACFVLFPTRQDLRPEVFPRENLLTAGVAFLYRIDTNTGVCPSLHVAWSLGIASIWTKQEGVLPFWKALVVLAVGLVCLSTLVLKQHSAVDLFAALPVCLLAEWLVFKKKI